MTRRTQRGFTLLEVMIGLALLGLALTILIQSVSGSSVNTRAAQLMGVSTDLARGKMYEIEEKLLKDGYSDTTQMEEDLTFEEEGWPSIRYSYKVEEVRLPSFDALQAMTKQQAETAAGSGSAGSGEGSGEVVGFENSALGGMLSQLGGFGGAGGASDAESSMGAAFIQSQYNMVQDVLKASIRKVTLVVTYDVVATGGKTGVGERCPWDLTKKQCKDGTDNDGDGKTDAADPDCYSPTDNTESEQIVCMRTVAFFTDAASMDKVLSGLGRQDLDDIPGGTGSGGGPAVPPTRGGGFKPPPGSGGTTK